jgi:hypothetical protein
MSQPQMHGEVPFTDDTPLKGACGIVSTSAIIPTLSPPCMSTDGDQYPRQTRRLVDMQKNRLAPCCPPSARSCLRPHRRCMVERCYRLRSRSHLQTFAHVCTLLFTLAAIMSVPCPYPRLGRLLSGQNSHALTSDRSMGLDKVEPILTSTLCIKFTRMSTDACPTVLLHPVSSSKIQSHADYSRNAILCTKNSHARTCTLPWILHGTHGI